MTYGDYRDYNRSLGDERACDSADRRNENPPEGDDECDLLPVKEPSYEDNFEVGLDDD